ncbi:capsular polysaccharide synthesis protein [Treponema sp. Marseille-Q4130]|uniref:capsular polysaccharide synthesis protein n=1 Tax=Treponema sp. Marseille-Q4130 TaxID=2766702 RepID=UPI0016525F48|nr:capsular polysaccharide synthesis protein [Treponema sp. Marseille-Q4130]MBC6719334.1 capsular polysaccharide synthesis protein [Treponema sp. Marseille-Q4130]
MNLITKSKILFQQKNYKDLIQKIIAYLRFLCLKCWFIFTGKSLDPDLKKTNKDWIIFTYLKYKYKNFTVNSPVPGTGTEQNNIIWWCWLQGIENAPPLCKCCLKSLHKNMPNNKIIIITYKNIYDYVDFPEYIKEKYRKGVISDTHFSDLLRLQLLITYGGTWIDATVFCTKYPEYAFNVPLFVFQTRERNDPGIAAQNWFIHSEKNNPILTLTRDYLFDYWKSHNFLLHYFVFYFFFKLATERYPKNWKAVPWFPDLPPHILQRELSTPYSETRFNQIQRMSDIHKLSYKLSEKKSAEKTFFDHIMCMYENPN